MSILIANLGTSDLTVQTGDFFVPIFQRDFTNNIEPLLTF